MEPLQTLLSGIRRSLRLSGRAGRAEFWWFFLTWLLGPQAVGFLVSFPIGFAAGFHNQQNPGSVIQADFSPAIRATYLTMALLTIWLVAFSIRRLHDLGRTGWWALLPIPIFLAIVAATGIGLIASGLSAKQSGAVTGSHWWSITLLALAISALPLARASQPGFNRYGPNPQEVTQ